MKIYTNVIIFLNNGKKEKGQLVVDTMAGSMSEPYYCYYIFSNLWKGRGYYENDKLQNRFKGCYQITGYTSINKFLSCNINEFLKKGLTRKGIREYSRILDIGWAWPSNVKKIILAKDLYNYKKIEL